MRAGTTCGHKKATSKRLPATINTPVASMALTKTKRILNRRQSLRRTAFGTCLQTCQPTAVEVLYGTDWRSGHTGPDATLAPDRFRRRWELFSARVDTKSPWCPTWPAPAQQEVTCTCEWKLYSADRPACAQQDLQQFKVVQLLVSDQPVGAAWSWDSHVREKQCCLDCAYRPCSFSPSSAQALRVGQLYVPDQACTPLNARREVIRRLQAAGTAASVFNCVRASCMRYTRRISPAGASGTPHLGSMSWHAPLTPFRPTPCPQVVTPRTRHCPQADLRLKAAIGAHLKCVSGFQACAMRELPLERAAWAD